MENKSFAGALLRICRLEKNWSQETLCQGICAVSYLSKIEQGKVHPNNAILCDLFEKLGVTWKNSAEVREESRLCEDAYEAIFSGDSTRAKRISELFEPYWEDSQFSPCYLDLLVLKAYFKTNCSLIPKEMHCLLDQRQNCIVSLLQDDAVAAMRHYPCAFSILCVGAAVYSEGKYTEAVEHLQRGYDSACCNGYVHLMMYCQLYIANCYSDLRNIDAMKEHNKVARRLALLLGDSEIIRTIDYNTYSIQIECGEFESAYSYFSKLGDLSCLELHKLAVCCEKLGLIDEARDTIDRALSSAQGVEYDMCKIVEYRLENNGYLHDSDYGEMLIQTFCALRKERSAGYARFHLPWVEEWCTTNRQYRYLYETLRNFI